MKLDSSAFVADRELMQALELRSQPVHCNADRILFRQGEPPSGLFLLQSGAAELTMTSHEGHEIFHISAAAGSVLGLPALIGSQPFSLTAKAAPGAKVRFVPAEEFSRMMADQPALSLSILRVLAAEVRTARYAFTEC